MVDKIVISFKFQLKIKDNLEKGIQSNLIRGQFPAACSVIYIFVCMSESEYIHKSHNVSVLLYHFVCPAKYRKVVFNKAVDETLKEVCLEIEKRYEVHFLEIGTDKNHVHFLIQSVPGKSPTQIIKMLKSVTAREIFRIHPEVKLQLWGGEF